MSSLMLKGKFSLALACACTLVAASASLNAQTAIATILLAGSPAGIGVDPVAKRVYVAEGNQVQVISEVTNTVVASFNLPTTSYITTAIPDPATGLIYVAAENAGLYVVDPTTYLPVGYVNVDAFAVAVNPQTDRIYVSDFNQTLYVIDGKSNTIDKTLTVNAITNLAVNPVTDRIYAAINTFPAQVTVINGKNNKIVTTESGGGFLGNDVTVDVLHNTFDLGAQSGTVSLFNGATNSLNGTVQASTEGTGIRVDPVTQKVFQSDFASNVVDVVDSTTKTVVGTVPVGANPEYMDIDPFAALLYVGNTGSDSLTVIKTR